MLNLPLWILNEKELSTAAASVTFTLSDETLPSAWTGLHLVIIVSARGAQAAQWTSLGVRFNGDSGSNYNFQRVTGEGSTASAGRTDANTITKPMQITADSAGADIFSGGIILIPDYADTTRHKTLLALGGPVEDRVEAATGRWASTAAITSITLDPDGGDLMIGSRFILALVDERYRIQKSVLSGDGTFDIQNIPGLDGQLVILGTIRSTRGIVNETAQRILNNDTTDSNYGRQRIRANGSTASASAAADRSAGIVAGANATSDVVGAYIEIISQYGKGDDDAHDISFCGNHESSGPNGFFEIYSARRNNAAAVTRFGVGRAGSPANYKSGSSLWLYHVPKTHVRRVEATANVASYTFSDLPAGEALIINIYARTDTAAATEGVDVEFNADTTAANYDRQRLEGDGGTVTAARSAAEQEHLEVPGDSATANIFGGGMLLIPAFSKTDRHKHSLFLGGPADDMVEIVSRRWENTAAITSVKLTPSAGGNFVDGTVIEVSAVPTLASQTVTRKTKTAQTS